MIRQASLHDVAAIEATYDEHFRHEAEHTAYTVFKKGVYPTRRDAEQAVRDGAMFVYEVDGTICGSIIIDRDQPVEYHDIPWRDDLPEEEVLVIHLLLVRPSMSGRGIATALLRYADETAKEMRCKVLRLDTGNQNVPAVTLYEKNGFEVIARAPKKVGDVIAHKDHLYLERPV